MPATVKQPEFVEFCAVPVIEAAAEGKDLPRFSMVAYSGGTMRVAGFPHAVVVDLAGLEIPNQSVPIRLDLQVLSGRRPYHAYRSTRRAACCRGADQPRDELGA